MKTELSNEVILFQESGEGWDNLYEKISLFIYQWGLKKKSVGNELASEFYLSFVPRIKHLVKNYRDHNCPFEAYLRVCLEWHIMKFHKQTGEKRKKEEVYWKATGSYDVLLASQPEVMYHSSHHQPSCLPEGKEKIKFQKRLLEYLIYYVDLIPGDMISKYALYLDMDKKKLVEYLEYSEELIRVQRDKREAIMQKKRSYYIDLQFQQMKLRIADEEIKRKEIQDRILRLKGKMESLKKRINRIKMTPTTIQVAQIMGNSPSATGRDIKLVKDFLEKNGKKNNQMTP